LTGVVWSLLALLSWLVLEKYPETATAGRMYEEKNCGQELEESFTC
jgi:hypothetical protein